MNMQPKINLSQLSANVASSESGSFIVTLTGMADETTGEIFWFRSGSHVTLEAPVAITGTSNSASMNIEGIPEFLQPSRSFNDKFGLLYDNGSLVGGIFSIIAVSPYRISCSVLSTAGLSNTRLAVTGFNTSGNKGIPAGWNFTYTLD